VSCQRAQEQNHGYIDGELDPANNLEMERHIQECQVCASAYRSQTALRSLLRDSSLYYPASEKLKKRVQSVVRKEAQSERSPRPFAWRWVAVGASLAFMLLIGVMMWRVLPGISRSSDELLAQELVSNHVRSLMLGGSHLSDVLSSDQHTVKPWFDGKVDFAPPVKDFAGQDFRLYGGRLEYLNNRSVATLVYQRRLHYINLYIWPTEQSGSAEEITFQRQGYNLIHWTSSGMSYWAISDLNNVELHEFARLVQQQ